MASMVVKGYPATSASDNVAELNNDDFPTFGFPVTAIWSMISLFLLNKLNYVFIKQFKDIIILKFKNYLNIGIIKIIVEYEYRFISIN